MALQSHLRTVWAKAEVLTWEGKKSPQSPLVLGAAGGEGDPPHHSTVEHRDPQEGSTLTEDSDIGTLT